MLYKCAMAAFHRFNDALAAAAAWLSAHRVDVGDDALLLRDERGRLYVSVPVDAASFDEHLQERLDADFRDTVGSFAAPAGAVFIFADSGVAINVFEREDARRVSESSGVGLVDRQFIGLDWTRGPVTGPHTTAKRVTFYGMKGGVGRSTALAMLALRLARRQKTVAVVDLDLESPGISNLLLPGTRHPDAGVVDWLVEDHVRQADAELIARIGASSPLGDSLPGSIIVAPAYGAGESHYIEKLARAYAPLEEGGGAIEHFAQRLQRFLVAFETENRADVVLLDSRAGLHDVAAVALTRLGATAFLFATNSPQTWQAYGLLFRHWQRYPQITATFRDNLKLVDALVPETDRPRHSAAMLEAAHRLFADTIYEDSASTDLEAFNFAPGDSDAPHHPLRINWNRRFQEFDPISDPDSLNEKEIEASFGEFLDGAERLLE